jgi:hypothetical protein
VIDAIAAALLRQSDKLEVDHVWKGMEVLANSEPHTSYRTPLALEAAFLELFEVLRTSKKTVVKVGKKEDDDSSTTLSTAVPATTVATLTLASPPPIKRIGRSKAGS